MSKKIDRKRIWIEHMKKIMNKENDWDQMTYADVVSGPIQRITRLEMINALKKMKRGKAAGSFEMNTEMILTNGKSGVEVMMGLCQHVLMKKAFQMNERQRYSRSQFTKEKEML